MRISSIEEEMRRLDTGLNEFLEILKVDFYGMVKKIDEMKNNLGML